MTPGGYISIVRCALVVLTISNPVLKSDAELNVTHPSFASNLTALITQSKPSSNGVPRRTGTSTFLRSL